MEKYNKQIIIGVFILILIFIFVMTGMLIRENKKINNIKPLTDLALWDVNELDEDDFYKPTPIPLEWMKTEEKADFNLYQRDSQRIQVLKRDDDGNIVVYKIINSDEDILDAY